MAHRLVLLALLLISDLSSVALADDGAAVPDVRVYRGEWVWNQGDRGDVEARFTAREDGRWDVTFSFEFRRRGRVYEGIADGRPGTGRLSGTVKNENGRRTFTFEGTFEKGRFEGKHAEVFGERRSPTGTIWLGNPEAARQQIAL